MEFRATNIIVYSVMLFDVSDDIGRENFDLPYQNNSCTWTDKYCFRLVIKSNRNKSSGTE